MTCPICQAIKAKEKPARVYEDEAVLAVLAKNPTAVGHVEIFPKQHVKELEELYDDIVQHLFLVASITASAAFEGMGAHGTNIIIHNGEECGSRYEHLCIHVIPRTNEDGLSFKWEPKPTPQDKLEEIRARITDKSEVIGKEAPKKPKGPVDLDKGQVIKDFNRKRDMEDYRIRQLERMP